ncbi:MAG: DUF1569 domain-containing protein [Phycisphaeraceae bacterium]|nr:DUF1569 domain-containing protein [Phycisphaerales bacterium]QOJ16835.1 MAG: DUF1569 domain-containing protein [Phycisphaeraceae bacterium]
MTVRTNLVKDRRPLHFTWLGDLLADVQQFDGATVIATGNWTPAQIVQHVAKLIHLSIDGFQGLMAPFILRALGRLFKRHMLTRPLKPGITLPGRFDLLLPDPDVTWDDAVSELWRAVDRVQQGERMEQPSPVLGPLTHEEWEQLHCRHAEMHFSFLKHGGT